MWAVSHLFFLRLLLWISLFREICSSPFLWVCMACYMLLKILGSFKCKNESISYSALWGWLSVDVLCFILCLLPIPLQKAK